MQREKLVYQHPWHVIVIYAKRKIVVFLTKGKYVAGAEGDDGCNNKSKKYFPYLRK